MSQSHYLLKGTFTLTAAGILSRIAGFFYKIFLSRTIGSGEIGLFQLCMPVYSFCMAAASGGIQTALSRFTAEHAARKDPKSAFRTLLLALFVSLTTALSCSILLYQNAELTANRFLAEPRCAPLLQILAFSLPFCVLHACLSGYFIGLKQVRIPAFSQIAEQVLRIAAVFFFYSLFEKHGKKMNASVMALGQLAGELASSMYCGFFLIYRSKQSDPDSVSPAAPAHDSASVPDPKSAARYDKVPNKQTGFKKTSGFFSDIRRLLSVSAPLGVNRMLLCVLHAIEAALLPQQLRLFGLSSQDALSVYGTLTGMALPLLLFPTAVTGSLGTLLLPLVSEARALDQEKRIADTTKATVNGSLLLGFLFFSVFFLFGKELGILLFANERAGVYIRILSLTCPFLYLNTAAASILHGLDQTTAASAQNLIGFLLRLASVLLLVPERGINGYFAGIIFSHAFVTIAALFTLVRNSSFRPTLTDSLLKPALSGTLTTAALSLLKLYVPYLNTVSWSALLLKLILCVLIFTALTICCYGRNTTLLKH